MKKRYLIITRDKDTGELKNNYVFVYTIIELENIIKYEYNNHPILEICGIRDNRNNPISIDSLII